MLKVINLEVDQLKEEMLNAKTIRITKPSAIKKRYGNGHRYEDELKRNDLLKKIYSPSKTLPVKVGKIIVNYKLYQSFMKKLKGFETKIVIEDECIRLEYWKQFSKQKGEFILIDISCFFQGFSNIPNAEIIKNG